MRYVFSKGTDGNLNDPANWQPAGGPPGMGDVAVFRNGTRHTETLQGTAAVGVLEFYGGQAGSNFLSTFVLDSVTLSAAMPLGAQFVDCYASAENSALTTNLLGLTGTELSFEGGSLQTGRTTIGSTAGAGWESNLLLNGTTWTNTGGVVLSNSPKSSSSSAQLAQLAVVGSTVTIGGDVTADAGDYTAGVSILESSVTVGGNVVLSGSAALALNGGVDGSVMRIDGNLLVNPGGASGGGPLGAGLAYALDGTIDVGGNIVTGRGAELLASYSGVLKAGGAITILDGGMGTLATDGTIETNTLVLNPMAFLSGPVSGALGGPSVIEGLGGGDAIIFNQGTIEAQHLLTIDGNITDQGTLLVGQGSQATGDMTVNGTVTAQGIRFGAPGSQFFAQDFGVGNAALHFLQGDTLATPGIASIGFDAGTNTLTIDKQSGAVEHLAMGGVDYTGQQFTLTDNEFITLQPATA